ncbi:hypothetical protein Enr13x_37230 [Stieleria neptunia]|uniref:DUF3618 domain-containing protein n=1 Tax=Stieleria neptunia TaxID=2527979 RepID=A0A518HSM7_9BACT|nr:DUF3618 domain-containing protein [Stieleria neptunia]QDV43863.1 hypothetical protein Enr13x_37230 [Stieleria neptunia]
MATSQNQVNKNGHYDNRTHVNRVPPIDDLEHRDSGEIKRRIDQTRGAMDETLDELGERLNPRNLLDDVISIFRSPQTRDTAKRASDAASDFASNLSRQVSENPIGATLVGAGLAWLALGSRRDTVDPDDDAEMTDFDDQPYYTENDLLLDPRYDGSRHQPEIIVPESFDDDEDSQSTLRRARDQVSSAASTAGDALGSTWESTKAGASSAAESASDATNRAGNAVSAAASSVVSGAKSAASSVGEAVSSATASTSEASRRAYLRSRAVARDAGRVTRRAGRRSGRQLSDATSQTGDHVAQVYDRTTRRVQRAHDETPLALGLGILALGAITGALIPRTRREDEWMGEQSDAVTREAQRQAERAINRGQEAVENTVEAAKQSAQSQGLTGDSLAERATRVVEKASDSIREAAREERLHPEQLRSDAETVAEDAKQQAMAEGTDAKQAAKAEVAQMDEDAKKAIDS